MYMVTSQTTPGITTCPGHDTHTNSPLFDVIGGWITTCTCPLPHHPPSSLFPPSSVCTLAGPCACLPAGVPPPWELGWCGCCVPTYTGILLRIGSVLPLHLGTLGFFRQAVFFCFLVM